MDVTFLEMLLYILGAMLLVALIVLTIKVIYSVNRINVILDSVEAKMRTVDKAFNAVDKVVDSISLASDKLVDGVSSLISRVFSRKNKKNKEKKESEEM